jgi:transposase
MASLQPFTSHGIRYWRIVESYRRPRDGHPATRNVMHLGKTEDLLARLQGAEPTAIRSVACGAVDAAAHVAEELGIPAVLDAAVHAAGGRVRRRDGLTVGQSLTAAAIARLCHPTSKRAVAAWATRTSLPQWLGVDGAVLTSQHFWDQMDAVPVAAIADAEVEVVSRVLKREAVTPRLLAYDTTNFFTHVATTNTKCTLAQRGHNKQHRDDLRQLGLALVVAEEDQLPLGHVLYDGARPDVTTFAAVLAPLRTRLYRLLPGPTQLTLVFDQGAESTRNLAAVRDGTASDVTHYVTALKPSAHRTWLTEAASDLTEVPLSSGEVVRAQRGRRLVHGIEQTAVIVWSPSLAAAQQRGIEQALAKAARRVAALSPHPRGGRAAIEQRAAQICRRQYLREFLHAEVVEEATGLVARLRINAAARRRLETEYLGFRVLATNREEWTTAQIIEAYRGQAQIERVFRDLKDPWVGAFRPQYHWTDQKIRVHALIVVLGQILGRLLLRRAQHRVGFRGSLRTLIERLTTLRRATLIYAPAKTAAKGKPGRPRIVERLEHEDEEVARLAAALNVPVAYTRSRR